MSVMRSASGWLFGVVDARTVAAMRISLGVILLLSHLLMLPDATVLFSDLGPVTTEMMMRWSKHARWSYYDHLTDSNLILGIHLLGILPLVGMIAGWKSRWMVGLALLVQVAIHHRIPWAQHGGDRVLRFATLSLLLVPCGAAWSVDAWQRARRCVSAPSSAVVPLVTHRFIQVQWVIIYAATGMEKVVGHTWQSGDALYYALSLRTFQRFPALTEALLASGAVQGMLRWSTWVTLGWELAFVVLVLFPRSRTWALLAGVAIHIGIATTMMVGTFSFAMMWGYLAFLPPDWVGRTAAMLTEFRSKSSRETEVPSAQ